MKTRICAAISHLKRCIKNEHFEKSDAEYVLSILEPLDGVEKIILQLVSAMNIVFFLTGGLLFLAFFSFLLFERIIVGIFLIVSFGFVILCIYMYEKFKRTLTGGV